MRWAIVGLLVAATLPVACGDAPPKAAAGPAPPHLAALPRAAVRTCAALATTRRVPVRCPTELPAANWTIRYRSLTDGPSAYLVDYETRGSSKPAGAAFHVLAGGRTPVFDLATTRAGTWPVRADPPSATCCNTRPTDLALVGARRGRHRGFWYPVRLRSLRRTTLAGHPALVAQAAGFPNGGIHGGHLVVLWNQGGAGYVLSMHFMKPDDLTATQRQGALVAAATAMSREAPSTDR
ncbi:MAG: hypothetical protein JWR63_2776 [Conexibacter sp.]|nr:hypothetical protein [Conexibacter sp.]